jgi:hypothetical protein
MIFVYILITGLPAVLVFFTIKKIVKARAVERHGIETIAEITHIALQKSSKGSSDRLTLEYSDNTGKRHAATASTLAGQYKPGSTMPLKYLRHNPSHYTIEGMQQGQWVILIFCILLLAFAIFASFKIDEMLQGSNFHFSP